MSIIHPSDKRSAPSQSQRKLDVLIWGVIVSAIVVATLVVALYLYRFGVGSPGTELAKKQDIWGQFGDYVGGTLNPFLSFLALVLLVRTYRLQRDELAATRDEVAQSRVVAQSAVSSAQLQRFETTLFSLIELVRSMRGEVRIDDGILPSHHAFGGDATRRTVSTVVEALRPFDMYASHDFKAESLFPVLRAAVSPSRLTQGAEAFANAAAQAAGFVERNCADEMSQQTYRPLALVALSVFDLETILIWSAATRDGEKYALFDLHYSRRQPSHPLLPQLISSFMKHRMSELA